MPIITIETYLSNQDYGGVDAASKRIDIAGGLEAVVQSLEDRLAEFGQSPLTQEERASIKVIGCEFIEADSNKLHGTCYFEVKLNVAESLEARLTA